MKQLIFFSIILLLSACGTSKKASEAQSVIQKTDSLNKRCHLSPEPGMCRAVKPRYYYDQTEGKCKEFIWGGCQGVVPFNTLEECMKACGCDTIK